MRLGAIASGINPRLGPAEVDHIVRQAAPPLVITEDATRAVVRLTPPAPARRLDATDPVAIVWTGGTTGRPKGAVFDHANLRADGAGRRPAEHVRRPAALAAAVRPRRVHDQDVGRARAGDHHRHRRRRRGRPATPCGSSSVSG